MLGAQLSSPGHIYADIIAVAKSKHCLDSSLNRGARGQVLELGQYLHSVKCTSGTHLE